MNDFIKAAWHRLFFMVIFFTAGQASAREGFFLPPLPPSLQNAWQNTYAVTYHSPNSQETIQENGHGTAFVVGKQMINGFPVIKMLTAGHVLDFGIEKFGSTQGFRAALFFKNIRSRELYKLGQAESPLNSKVIGAIESDRHDLALLVLVVDQKTYDTAIPISLPNNCPSDVGGEHYVFGFPEVHHRINESENFIPNRSVTQKRWSWGKTSSQRFKRDWREGSEILQGSSADCLEGCSGGPVIRADSTLEGILTQVVSKAAIHGYLGSDSPKVKTHSLFVPCKDIQHFLQQVGGEIPGLLRTAGQ